MNPLQTLIDVLTCIIDDFKNAHWQSISWKGHEELDALVSALTDRRDTFAELFMPILHTLAPLTDAKIRISWQNLAQDAPDYESARQLIVAAIPFLTDAVQAVYDSGAPKAVENELDDVSEWIQRYMSYKWGQFEHA
jgi:hypothetical protein